MPFHIFWSGSFAVLIGDHFRSEIIRRPIWRSFAVRDHLRTRTVRQRARAENLTICYCKKEIDISFQCYDEIHGQ